MKRSDIPTVGVLSAVQCYRTTGKGNLIELLMKMFNAPEKLVYSALERDEDRGFLEYGVSIRCCWLTRKGIEYLESIKPPKSFKDGGIVSGSMGNADHGCEVIAPLSVLQKIKIMEEVISANEQIGESIRIPNTQENRDLLNSIGMENGF